MHLGRHTFYASMRKCCRSFLSLILIKTLDTHKINNNNERKSSRSLSGRFLSVVCLKVCRLHRHCRMHIATVPCMYGVKNVDDDTNITKKRCCAFIMMCVVSLLAHIKLRSSNFKAIESRQIIIISMNLMWFKHTAFRRTPLDKKAHRSRCLHPPALFAIRTVNGD